MNKIINFHPSVAPDCFDVNKVYAPMRLLIKDGLSNLHTYQMALLDYAWERGYTIHIWYNTGTTYQFDEFYPGRYVYGKELRKEHNFGRLWIGGALGDHVISGYRE